MTEEFLSLLKQAEAAIGPIKRVYASNAFIDACITQADDSGDTEGIFAEADVIILAHEQLASGLIWVGKKQAIWLSAAPGEDMQNG
jgi:hypothetical protein